MSRRSECAHCGYVGPEDARYCGHCGRPLIPFAARLRERTKAVLDRLAPIHTWVLGLALLILTGVLSNHVIVWRLGFRLLIVVLLLGIGCAMAYLGWEYATPASTRRHLSRTLLVFSCLLVSLVALQLINLVLLAMHTNGADRVIYCIPGVYAELTARSRRLIVDNVPPYWLGVTLYGLFALVMGHLIHRTATRQIRVN
jgi:hypothetical protein